MLLQTSIHKWDKHKMAKLPITHEIKANPRLCKYYV